MALYESVFIARQDLSVPQVEALTETFSQLVESNGGKVPKKEYWGLRSLSFRIKKNRKGHYTLFNLDAPAAAIHEMERQMRINEDVLRYLTVRVESLEEGQSMMLQRAAAKEERMRRDDRGPREDRWGRGGGGRHGGDEPVGDRPDDKGER
ncbi:MAG: 30S ribosomal protein S6 [Rhodospirillales bacterium]|nr:30S ribosomal protein S6 [Rhodospirillales bacterium]